MNEYQPIIGAANPLRGEVAEFFQSRRGERFPLDAVAEELGTDPDKVYWTILSLRWGRKPGPRGRKTTGPHESLMITAEHPEGHRGPWLYGIPDKVNDGNRYLMWRQKTIMNTLDRMSRLAKRLLTDFPLDVTALVISNAIDRLYSEVADVLMVEQKSEGAMFNEAS